MNDSYEKIWIDVFDGDRILVGREVLPEYDVNERVEACHVCTIMAKAIGREIGHAFKDDEEKAVKIIARLSYEILSEFSAAQENR